MVPHYYKFLDPGGANKGLLSQEEKDYREDFEEVNLNDRRHTVEKETPMPREIPFAPLIFQYSHHI